MNSKEKTSKNKEVERMKKKILSVALLAVMVLSLTLAGCGTGSSGSGGTTGGQWEDCRCGHADAKFRKVDKRWPEHEGKAGRTGL